MYAQLHIISHYTKMSPQQMLHIFPASVTKHNYRSPKQMALMLIKQADTFAKLLLMPEN
jgi:hypothetical protein